MKAAKSFRMKKHCITVIQLLLLSICCAQPAPSPYGALPTERQLRWHEQLEMYGLVHFSPTTYQRKQWGYGDADPAIFHPQKFDADQIAKAAAAAGLKGIILVAKHHDGFCLWPTKTTPYNISKSPWKNGKGDMVKEFMLAAQKNGLKYGLYLSAWDRNYPDYGQPKYAEAYREQLTELMTGYGPLFTSWHDGANGGDGHYGGANEKRIIDRGSYYAWEEKTWPLVRKYQPMAMIFSDIGLDMRWAGNEKGILPETSWATFTPLAEKGEKIAPGQVNSSENLTGTRNGKFWIPAECDFPLRVEWFYNPDHDITVKTPQQLFDIYLTSVGRGGAFDIGLSPNLDGLLPERDAQSLAGFGKKLNATFGVNLANGAVATATNIRGKSEKYGPALIFDTDRYSYYASDDDVLSPALTITLKGEKTFDIIRLRENIKLGQRLDSVRIDIWRNGEWSRLAAATSIGATRLIKLATPVTAHKLRVQLFAPVPPALSDFALFKEAQLKFEFTGPAVIEKVKLKAQEYKILSPSGVENAFDNNPATFTAVNNKEGVVLEIKGPVKGLTYLPRQDGQKEGIPTKYTILISNDNVKWSTAASGEFSNIINNPVEQTVYFKQMVNARYLKFIATETNIKELTIAEIALFR